MVVGEPVEETFTCRSLASTLKPKPSTLNPQPEKPNPKLSTLNSKPKTRNTKRETRNQKPETRNPKPETRNPKQVDDVHAERRSRQHNGTSRFRVKIASDLKVVRTFYPKANANIWLLLSYMCHARSLVVRGG